MKKRLIAVFWSVQGLSVILLGPLLLVIFIAKHYYKPIKLDASQPSGYLALCTSTSDSGAIYTCNFYPPLVLNIGAVILLHPTMTNTGRAAIVIDGKQYRIAKYGGLDLTAADLWADSIYSLSFDGDHFELMPSAVHLLK